MFAPIKFTPIKYRARVINSGKWLVSCLGMYITGYTEEYLKAEGKEAQEAMLLTEEGWIPCDLYTVGISFGLKTEQFETELYTGDIIEHIQSGKRFELVWGEYACCLLFHEVGTNNGSIDLTALDEEYGFINFLKVGSIHEDKPPVLKILDQLKPEHILDKMKP